MACGNKLLVVLKDDSELEEKFCPVCKSSNLIKFNANSFFGIFSGGFRET